MQELRRFSLCGKMAGLPKNGKQLSPVAQFIAEKLASSKGCNQKRQKKTDQSYPCEQDIEESQCQIDDGINPKIVVPVLFHSVSPTIRIIPAGHSFAHVPQPAQRVRSTSA